ncbi:NAD-dependent epimerase/dehydratase family protein [Nostoc sp. CHAB 5715]|uniref:NAD-dependent epimerase/dehydratase family protein n=1 Tax=Nostoc sp. CHAB 5715 TaxID=2780400 RepID=UPI001E3761FB|nr:NAD-dependent epimerase/dehydratase family protein [Nostoc sp. CHAB 5715]MCC5620832.1 NAD-dependent epimerase/dehydratase family protein [Nostoc sp. CHAB 5715]
MKILVTGATGFLGTILCSQLEAQGHELVRLNSKNCDLTQQDSLLKFKQEAYDHIYHLAAWTQAGDFCLYHPGEQWIINQQINTNVLTWWQKYQPQAKLISMGTSCAYAPHLELVEENYLTGIPIDSLFTYAMTKRMLYAGHLALNKQFGLKYLCLVPSTLYGPGYHTDGRQMHFIFDLIRKIIRAKLYGEPVILWGDGYQSRELVFVDDFVNIMIQLAASVDNQLINIGAGEEFTIRHFAKLICEKVDYDFNGIKFDTGRYVGAKSKCLAVGKLQQYIPDLTLTSLEVGLTKTIEWFGTQKEKLLPDNK